MALSNLARLRKLCLSLPEATEVEAWGEPTFRVGKIFAMYAASNNHHGDGREGVWVKSNNFTQDLLVRGMPQRYFKPPYVGPFGWTGVYLDAKTDWSALTELLRDSYRMAASKKLAALLVDDEPASPIGKPKKRAAKKRAPKPAIAKRSKRVPATKRKRSR
jgi:predicted DNA-binding protein (MmcQ/YjbR family)